MQCVVVGVGGDGEGCPSEEGFLISAHQHRSFSTGGRVVQEHRDTPAGGRQSRQSEGDGIEQQQLEDTQTGGDRKPYPDPAQHHFLSAVGLNPLSISNRETT